MSSFFAKYPKLIINNKLVTDIIARTAIREKYSDKLSIYYPYNLQEGDSPEIVAAKYYGDPEKHWIVMLGNETINPFFDFPLDYQTFNRHIANKYKKHANSLNIWENSTWRGEWSPDSYVISDSLEPEHNDTWVRDTNWLALPTVTNLQKFAGLFAVFPGATSFLALSATTSNGTYRVDWGDGNVETFGSGAIAQHIYDYSTYDVVNDTLLTRNNISYKQVIVSVTPVTGNLIGVNLNKKHNSAKAGYNSPWLDIAINGSHMTSFILSARLTNTYFPLLESLYIAHVTQSDFQYLLNTTVELKHVSFHNSTVVTSIGDMFKGISAVPLSTNYTLVFDETNPLVEYVFNRNNAIGYYEGSPQDDDRVFRYYKANTVVISNTAFVCTTEHTPTVFMEDLKKKYWERIYDGVYWKDQWVNDTNYNIDDVVNNNSTIYICLQDHKSNAVNGLSYSNGEYWKTYNDAIEYATLTTYGYRANITSIDTALGIPTTQTIYIDKKSFNGGDNGYDSAIFNYANETLDSETISVTNEKERISIYQYEHEMNEKKREIKLIRKEYVSQLENEFKLLMETSYV